MKNINLLNVTAESFDVEQFNTLVRNVKRAQANVADLDKNYEETKAKFDVANANIQKAINEANYDDMQKFVAEAKRLESRLGENPQEKVAEFDKALNEICKFFGNTNVATEVPVEAKKADLKVA